MLEELLKDTEQLDIREYTEMLVNLYEDEDAYTAEIVFDDDVRIIGRDEKRYVIAEKDADFNEIRKQAGEELKAYCKEHKDRFKSLKTIACGFVDGDLYYVRKPRKRKKELPHFSKEDFSDFNEVKLKAWLTVYLNAEGQKKYEKELLELAAACKGLPEEEMEQWREILAQYFDYDKYADLN